MFAANYTSGTVVFCYQSIERVTRYIVHLSTANRKSLPNNLRFLVPDFLKISEFNSEIQFARLKLKRPEVRLYEDEEIWRSKKNSRGKRSLLEALTLNRREKKKTLEAEIINSA